MKGSSEKYNSFFSLISYLLHPITIPLIAVVLYFVYSPHYMSSVSEMTIVGVVFFITYLIPLLAIISLWSMKLISSLHMPFIADRKRPLILVILLYTMLIVKVFKRSNFYELNTFFLGATLALLIVYMVLFFNKKISLHMLGLGGLLGFFINISMYQHENYLKLIVVLLLLSGLVASARLVLKAHTTNEVVLGFFIGLFSQFIFLLL